MRSWELSLSLAGRPADVPVYRHLAAVVAADIERGRLAPGERLSSSRSLAERLGLNRNTVVAAFDQLRRDGWLEGGSTAGTFVARALPRRRAEESAPPGLGFALGPEVPLVLPAPRSPDVRLLLGGVVDLRLLPSRQLSRAYGRALRGARGRRALDYADPQGELRLRTALGALLTRTRGLVATPEAIGVVRGSQQGLYLVAQALIGRGDRVIVEDPGFPPAWQALRAAGAELVPVKVDQGGLDVDAVEAACAAGPVRAVVVTPHHQHPTTVTLSAERRRRLLALARKHRLIVVEDDVDFEFHYEGPPVLPLASEPGALANVVYVATLSKTLAPGLRLGYVVAHPEVVRQVIARRVWVDQQGDHVVEQAVAELLEEGELQAHTRRMRRVYRARRDALLGALAVALPELVASVPSGGLAVWARAPGVDTTRWAAASRAAGVVFQAGGALAFDGLPNEHVRLGFAACTEAELVDATRRMAATIPIAARRVGVGAPAE